MKNNQKGFSLIELSIVLIIIGLLVSGITGGASLVNSARVRATMTEVDNYRIAVNTYYTAKDMYPGDTDSSADGKILGNEMDDCWEDLEAVDAVDRDYSDATDNGTSGYTVQDGLGYSKNAGAGWLMGYYDNTEETSYSYNVIALTDVASNVTANASGVLAGASGNIDNGTTVINASTMDIKMDDGEETTGNVVGLSSTDTACNYGSTTPTQELCVPAFSINL